MNYTDRSAVYIHTGEDITQEIKQLIQKLLWIFILALTISMTGFYLYRNHQAVISNIKKIQNSLLASDNSCNASKDEIKKGLMPNSINIPSQNIDMKIVPTHFKNGSWEVRKDVANYAIGTSLINMESGNTGIYGNDSMEVFRKLKDVKKADSIYITASNADNNEFVITYEVLSTGKIVSKDSGLFYPKEDSQLTVIATGEKFSDQRYVVTARPISLDKTDCK